MEAQALAQRDHQQRMQALMQMMGLMQSGQEHTDQMSAHAADAKTAVQAHMTDTKATVLGGMADRGNSAATDALANMFPELGDAQAKIHGAEVDKQARGLLPSYLAAQSNPKLKASLPSVPPEVEAAITALMPKAPIAPTVESNTAIQGREGGILPEPFNPYSGSSSAIALLGPQGAQDFNQQLIKANAARRAKSTPEDFYNSQHPLDGLYNLLFGNPKSVTP